MSDFDFAFPFILFAFAFIAIVGGCDLTRIQFLEDDCREYRNRIQKLELQIFELRIQKVGAK